MYKFFLAFGSSAFGHFSALSLSVDKISYNDSLLHVLLKFRLRFIWNTIPDMLV